MSFQDDSYGQPSGWLWSFGDGSTSTLQNPIHSYTSEGTYDVSLFVSNKETNKETSYVPSLV